MAKRISIILCLILFFGACSSSKPIDPLDEDLVFDEEQADLVQDLDFDEEVSDDEEFKALDEAEDETSLFAGEGESDDGFNFDDGESEDSKDDFSLFDVAENSQNSNNDEDDDFSLFDDGNDDDRFQGGVETVDDFNFEDSFDGAPGFDSPVEVVSPSLAKVNASSNTVLSVDYNALQNGGSFVVSTADVPFYETEYVPETNQYILKLKKSQIAKKLARPFLTKDFRQSFEAMNSYKGKDNSVKFVFQLKPDSYPKVSRLGNKILIEPGIKATGTAKENNLMSEQEKNISLSATSFEDFLLDKNSYVGSPISIQVKEEDVVTIIQFISEQVGANIVISESVKGKISIKLKEVPWDQALISIMKAKGLGYVRSGNILRIASLAELQTESKTTAEIQDARKILAPFHTKVFPLSYAQPADLETRLKPFLTTASEGSKRAGQVISDNRSSSVIVRDTLDVIKSVSDLIKELDMPPLQVMIQAKIVEATKRFTKEISGFFQTNANTSNQGGTPSAGLGGLFNGNGINADSTFVPSFSLSGLNFLGTLTARLRLQELESNVKVLSSPSIMAVNNQKANIVQNDQIVNAVTVTTDEGTTISPEFRDVKLSLDVTPQVSADSNIIMDIDVTREFPVPAGNDFTTVASRTAKTKVIVGNNLTGMIGGIYQVNESKSDTGTPYLRKIPLLKWLFNNHEYAKLDTELVIFITPRIIGPSSIGGKVASKKLSPSRGSSLSKR